MIEDEDEQSGIMTQLTLYKEQRGYFGSKFAIKGISEIDPMAWWGLYEIDTPALMIAARRILGLCCTTSSCERNWSIFDFIHTKRRNRLEAERFSKLVFVDYNQRL